MKNRLFNCSQIIVLLFFFTMQVSCNKTEFNTEDCPSTEDKMSLTQNDLQTTCWYNEVYNYNNETYIVCVCCDCDKAPMAIDCSGEPLCDWTEDCMLDFYRRADLIGYVEF